MRIKVVDKTSDMVHANGDRSYKHYLSIHRNIDTCPPDHRYTHLEFHDAANLASFMMISQANCGLTVMESDMMRAVCSRLPPGTNFRTDHDGNWNAWLQDSGEEIDLAPIMAEQIGRAEQGKDIMNLDHLFYDLEGET